MQRSRIPTMACIVVVLVLIDCGPEKSVNPTHTLIGGWPAVATGLYELVIEAKYCEAGPFVNCNWTLNWTDTLAVCTDPVLQDFAQHTYVQSVQLDGIASDSLYDVTATITYVSGCKATWSYSTRATDRPPSRDGWQFLCRQLSISCSEIDPGLYRYTYTRIGDADCSGDEQ